MGKKINFIFLIILSCFLGDGFSQIQFEPFEISNNTQSTEGLYICDLDEDDDNDILGAAAENDHDVIWWRNDGGNPVQWTKIIIDGNFPGAGHIFAADINNDSHTDVIACAKIGNEVAWYENSGGNDISWTKHTIQSGYLFPHEVFAIDLDKDGNKDVLAASSTLGEITWFKNNGGNPVTWTRNVIASNYTQSKSVHVGDINGDSLLDVIGAGLGNNKISWWENDGNNPIGWIEHVVTNNFSGAHHIQATDINKDGRLDILGAGYYANEIAWWKNEGGNPVAWTKQTIAANFINVCIAMAIDIDNDSNLDIVGSAQSSNEVAWWRSDGGNPIVWTKYIIDGSFSRVWPLYAGDIDKDGDADVVAASGYNGNNQVKWYRSNLSIGIKNISTEIPISYSISQNYPNPFNPVTNIRFNLPQTTHAKLTIYDVLGNEVATLSDEVLKAGSYLVSWNASNQPSGVYFYKLIIDNYVDTKKMVLLK
jgi:hypothetical protein